MIVEKSQARIFVDSIAPPDIFDDYVIFRTNTYQLFFSVKKNRAIVWLAGSGLPFFPIFFQAWSCSFGTRSLFLISSLPSSHLRDECAPL